MKVRWSARLNWMVVVVMVGISLASAQVPTNRNNIPKIAHRMVAKWWTQSREPKQCDSRWDCGSYECCARPINSQRAFCMPLQQEGAVCHTASFLVDKSQEVYFNSCPCLPYYACADLGTQERCVHPDRIGDTYYVKRILGYKK
ncbi:unnamed protein product [Darwinula stevensoni]|uniref:Prokineticin domain-containing protein n=1 Tax=Darwinula stevensoni TaxID=69355 RepID=A0A7R8X3Z6_9CRUS|nr:unnamed protein product [Darwinula stevensoni]CAG0883092.1 unnamed protein product [Darwinula stevensoni]